MYVCLSVCHGQTSNRFFFFVSRWNQAIFWPSFLHVALYNTFFFDFWFRPPNAQHLLPKIWQKSITRLVWQIDQRCLGLLGLGGFQGWPIQWNHTKCCGADPCCHERLANLGYFCDKSPISRLVCQIDRICLGRPLLPWQRLWARRRDLNAYRLVCMFASDYDDYDNGGSRGGFVRHRSRSPMSHRRRHLGDRVSRQSKHYTDEHWHLACQCLDVDKLVLGRILSVWKHWISLNKMNTYFTISITYCTDATRL